MKTKTNYLLYLSIIWILTIFVVNPIGDFPLNDDWSYAYNVEKLTLENKIVFHDWGAMTLFVHTLWGTLFCKIFGFSFTVLRFSTLFLGWGTLLVTFLFFCEGGIKRQYAFLGTILFGFNSFFLSNAFSYMTEVPFLFYFMTSALFFLKSINGKSKNYILYGSIFSILATLTRQIGVLLPIAFLFVFFIKNKKGIKTIIQAVLPTIATFLSLTLFTIWRKQNFGLSKNFGNTSDLLDNFLNGRFLFALEHKSYGYFVFWGLFMLPLLLLLIPYFWKKVPLLGKVISIVITLLFCYPFILIPNKEFMGNSFVNIGVGPFILPTSSETSPIQIGDNDWENLYLVGFIAAIFLVKWIFIKTYQLFIFIKTQETKTVNWNTLFALLTSFGYFLFLMLNNHYIDRYNIIVFPFLLLLLIPLDVNFKVPKTFKIIGVASLLLLVSYSIGVSHDYLSWNRARWKVTNYATNDLKIPKDYINGGFEYKGLNDIKYFVPTDWEDLDKWNTHQEQFKVAFSTQCKYNVVKTAPYFRYFPPRVDSMYLLKKEYLTQMDTIFCDAEVLSADGKHLLTNQKGHFMKSDSRIRGKSHGGDYSILLNQQQQYGFFHRLQNIEGCEKILISYWSNPPQYGSNGVLVDRNLFYLSGLQRLDINEKNGWGKSIIEFKVPSDFKEDELTFYIFNGGGQNIYFDDLSIIRMK